MYCYGVVFSVDTREYCCLSFPDTANHQPTADPSGTDSQQNPANPPPPNGPEGVDGNGPASEYDVNNGNQQPDSITGPPVQEEHRDVHTRTGNSYEHFVLKSR